jgi:Sec-independent protein translocase protein TatA
MDSFFGIGLPELIAILILAGLVLGPQRIREVARVVGKWTTVVQRYARQFTRQLNAELDAADMEDFRAMRDELQQLRRQVTTLQDDLKTEARHFAQGTRQIARDVENSLDPRLANGDAAAAPPAPPSLPNPLEVSDDPEA